MKDNNVIIHIGLVKTGSTYLQKFIFPHLSETMFIDGHDKFVPQWQEQIPGNNKHILISDENFSGKPWRKKYYYSKADPIKKYHPQILEENVKLLKQCFPKAKVVVFFRRHGDLVISMYRQFIKNRGTLSLKEFYGSNKVIRPSWLHYQRKIQVLRNHFDTVYCLDYGDFQKKGDQFILDFFEHEFGIVMENDIPESDNVNIGMRGRGLVLCRKMNMIYNKIPLPRIVRKGLRLLRLDPAGLVQDKLTFLNSEDPETFQNLKKQINQQFSEDWSYFLKHKYTI